MKRSELIEFLQRQDIDQKLLDAVEDFVAAHPVEEEWKDRIPSSTFRYYGKEIWEKGIYAILSGYHILLSGPKATGKNVFSENLAQLFCRPMWNMSLNVNVDSASLIGVDTFKDGEVVLKKGPVTLAAEVGGFAIFDEINMAKNESLSVVHSALDFRRMIDVAGYDRIPLNDATRFIGTMNYGYMGTRELNEALISRFMVIEMPILEGEGLKQILREETELNEAGMELFARLFMDLQNKSLEGEISSKTVDMRGLFGALTMIRRGLSVHAALDMGIVNKSFDRFEKEIVEDVIDTLFPADTDTEMLFR
ncbi:MoxR-like ATPase [Peptoniphilus ivorii]|uniref:AAA family ATPase n=1 Tax=Aedoeadaptatus ivorii TaxID=54006 RepID=UPI0027845F16|nr:MoxR family ATPase [Peptoniphilus ivorii]MDQ0508760.1 MoxR-like ATPase [Peptoniphilus ivorii]